MMKLLPVLFLKELGNRLFSPYTLLQYNITLNAQCETQMRHNVQKRPGVVNQSNIHLKARLVNLASYCFDSSLLFPSLHASRCVAERSGT